MATVVTKKIAPSGGDFTSLVTALASIPTNAVATDEQWDINCETFTGGLAERVTVPNINQDATRFVRIQAAPGHEYNPVDGTGFFLTANVGFGGVFTNSINFTQIMNFGVKNTRTLTAGRGIDFFGDNGVISGMYAESDSPSGATIFLMNNANNLNISNCLAHNGDTGFDFGNNGTRNADKLTAVDSRVAGIDTGTASTTVTNSLSISNADPYLGTFANGSSNNASSSTDAPGTNPQNNRTTADFADYANSDFRTSSSSSLATAGVGSTFIGYALEPSGGQIIVNGLTPNYTYDPMSGEIELTGVVEVNGQTVQFNLNSIAGAVDLTGEVIITGSSPSYSYSSILGSIDLTGNILIQGQTPSYNYASIDGSVSLSSQIDVVGKTPFYNYVSFNGDILLEGEIIVTGQVSQYQCGAIKGHVMFNGGNDFSNITASFADSGIGVIYKQDKITVKFKG